MTGRAVTTGIVHLGVGAFHRAHQAVYTDDVLARDPSWGIVAASLRSPDTYDALEPQDGLYTLSVRSAGGRGAAGHRLDLAGSSSRRRRSTHLLDVDEPIRRRASSP